MFYSFIPVFADMFLQHLNTELGEDDVQKLTSGSKAKAQITVVTALSDKIDQLLSLEFIVSTVHVPFPTFSGQNWGLYSVPIPWRSLDPSARRKTQTSQFSTDFWRPAGRI